MRNTIVGLALIVAGVATISLANPSFTDTAATDNYGKIGLKKLTADIDANFAAIEAGAYNVSHKPTSGAGSVTITGNETNEAKVVLVADDGDDADDTAVIAMGTDGTLDFRGTSGTNDVVTIDMDTGNVAADGSVAAGSKVTSYGYPAVVGHTNGSDQVWMTQSGSVVGDGGTTATQSFTVVFIAAPNVVITSSSAASATNAPYLGTIASNSFEVVTAGVGTNFQWIAHGRIK